MVLETDKRLDSRLDFDGLQNPDFSLLKEAINQEKLRLRNETVMLFPTDPMAGFKLGQAYKEMAYGLVRHWYKTNIPDLFKPVVGIGASGSTGRGELCFHSDIDLYMHPLPSALYPFIPEKLKVFMEDLGYKTDIKAFPHDYDIGGNEMLLDQLQQDEVQREFLESGEIIVGPETGFVRFKEEVAQACLVYGKSPQSKALYSTFELKHPRHSPRPDESSDDLFNIKWYEGGLANFIVLRAIARSYGIEGIDTPSLLKGMQTREIITENEYETLVRSLSEYMIYRNEKHLSAGRSAEIIGRKTRQYIAQNIPWVEGEDWLKARIISLRKGINDIYQKVQSEFLRKAGIDPDIFDKFSTLPHDAQLSYARSNNPDFIHMAAWSTQSPEVLQMAIQKSPDYVTLQAGARAKYADPETLRMIERITRDNPPHAFARLMLATNPQTPPDSLINLYRYSTGKTPAIARKRLLYLQYEDNFEGSDQLKHMIDVIIFYPNVIRDWYLRDYEERMKPGRNKLYINFAGRLANGKNFEPFLKLLEILQRKGVDFEAHIFGVMDPSVASQLDKLWETEEGHALGYKIKYHGRYTLMDLKENVTKMQRLGMPLFIFPKGLVSKELLSMQQPIFTTDQGNNDIAVLGMSTIDETKIDDPFYLEQIATQIVGLTKSPEQRKQLEIKTEEAQRIIREKFGLVPWGQQIVRVLEETEPAARTVAIIGKGSLEAAQGPASWSRNLLTFCSHHSDWQIKYLPSETYQPIIYKPQPFRGEIFLTGEKEVIEHVNELTEIIMSVPLDNRTPDHLIDGFVDRLLNIAGYSNAIFVLTGPVAKAAVENRMAGYGYSDIRYPVVSCDRVNTYGKLVHTQMKITRLVEMLQRSLPVAGIYLTSDVVVPLLAIREKVKNKIPFVQVDHILATDEPMMKSIQENESYTSEEKDWFKRLHKIIREATHLYLDKYVAIWPVNQQVAINIFGIPSKKVIYVPNGVNTEI